MYICIKSYVWKVQLRKNVKENNYEQPEQQQKTRLNTQVIAFNDRGEKSYAMHNFVIN
jgi:hypothetical protein